ncbi:hypothetical protein [Sphaerisporangium sp. TRM90804]|uniref:hypothetical protein n=1 Tax=Sphaerisporangium sp. TRM90804 TaxID=3031113 RepID=UPI002449A870|nr:hypothetical protein [Sphaerisporangium sp. TRM90804]MDH2424399.1 hypothetical protein [Sphaerisporangium sp. TRM90804]
MIPIRVPLVTALATAVLTTGTVGCAAPAAPVSGSGAPAPASGAPASAATPAASGGTPTAGANGAPASAGTSTPPRPASATAPRVPAGTTAAYMVVDRVTGKATLSRNAHARFRSASVVKILIALDYLESREAGAEIPSGDRALLARMLRSSDDDAATSFWGRGGQGKIIYRMARRAGLRDSGPPPAGKPGFWGYTALSVSDVVRTYRYLLDHARPANRALILGHLRAATECASDGFDQYFGIPRAVPRPWAVKQGWSGYGTVPAVPCSGAAGASPPAGGASGPASTPAPARTPAPGTVRLTPPVDLSRPVLHTTGLAGKGDRLILAVLTLQPAGSSYRDSAARLTTLAKQVYLAGRPG